MFPRKSIRNTLAAAGLAAILLGLIAATPGRAAPFNDGFASEKGPQYILNHAELIYDLGFEKVQGMQGKSCLRLRNENQKPAKFIMQTVAPGRQYELSFRSRFVNNETLENNPTLEETTRPGWKIRYRNLPTFEIVFFDKEQKAFRSTTTVTLPYGEWRRYRKIFIAPPKAAFVQFVFSSGINSGALYLDDMKFAATQGTPGKMILRFNGDKYDYSGWARLQVDAGMVAKDGKGYFNTGYGSTTEKVFVDPKATYRLTLKGVHYAQRSWAVVSVYDENGKKLQSDSFVSPCKEPIKMTTPPGAKYCDLLIYNCLLEGIAVEKQQ